MASAFSPKEREYIRRELDMFFSTFPTVAEGFQLKNWRGGPEAGKPKIPGVAQGLIDRGLMRLDARSAPAPRLLHRGRTGGVKGNDGGWAPRRPGQVRTYLCRAWD